MTRLAYPPSQRIEQLRLPYRDPLFRPQHLCLVFLQFRRDEPFGSGERLAPLVVRRHLREVGARHLDVVAEHAVVADLERPDAGPLALARLQRGDVLFATVAHVAQLVQLRVEPRPNRVPLGGLRRRTVHQCAGQLRRQICQHIKVVRRPLEQSSPFPAGYRIQGGGNLGQQPHGIPQTAQLPRRGPAHRGA